MDMTYERGAGQEAIVLSRRPTTVSIVVAVMGMLLVLQILIVFVAGKVALPLVGLLTVAAASAGWLSILALESMLPTTVTMDRTGITTARLLGKTSFEWADIGAVKLVPSDGMLSDDPKADASGRLAVGLFIKGRKEPRKHELDADFVIFGASDEHVNQLVRLIDHIQDFKATVGAGLPERGARIRKAAPIAPPASFRRPRQAS